MTKSDTIIRFPKHFIFPHSLYAQPKLRALLLSLVLLHIFIPNSYKDISSNFSHSIRKSNITIIYQFKNVLYNILYKKNFVLIRNLGHFPIISILMILYLQTKLHFFINLRIKKTHLNRINQEVWHISAILTIRT